MNLSRNSRAPRALAVAGLVAATLSVSACSRADASSTPAAGAKTEAAPPSVKLVSARTVKAAPREEVTGTLFPAQMLQVGFEVGGRLAAVKVGKGMVVKKGDVLGQLDVEISDAQVAQAEAAVAAAQAGADMAADVAARNQTLQKEGGVSDLQNRSTAAQAAQAQAQLLAAKAQLSQARAARRRHDLKAPFEGTLIDAPEQTGATVGPGTPLFNLERLDTLLLKTTVAESLRARLKPGQKVRVESIGGGAFTEDAVVRTILPSADPATRRVPVELAVPNADGRFVAHTLARAVLQLGDDQDARVVPGSALSSANGDHVLIVGSGGEVKRVDVQVLERREREVVVLARSEFESVIDHPTPSLSQGSRVTVK
ncbi:efflux RND transporter periplasmic adaptor subunit [Myxococcus sp. K38C18041901]|uniref:efflux RND transporter periplasmic adaptor subunit n=1 Tax=Myxococcus guangdongensis TaxID=2906760 RepID=UPI0020A6FAA0|nr:efflux RND transporter periplasmic adaptor subunit [Myxococcus guangdongensis]MCP3064665.1 efflux RND transporter periplasmic adaptor subunit [Myxococcus guangdongensis]